MDYNISTSDFRAVEILNQDWHMCFGVVVVGGGDTPLLMQFTLPSEGSWQSRQIFCSNVRHVRSA